MKILKLLFNRFVFIALAIILQITVYALIIIYGLSLSTLVIISGMVSVLVCLKVIMQDTNPSLQILWVGILLLAPLVGLTVYFFMGDSRWTKKNKERLRRSFYKQVPAVHSTDVLPDRYKGQINYLKVAAGTCAYRGCETKYFPSGEKYLESLLVDLNSAKKYILMEFFIIEQGKMWDAIFEVLKKKVAEGVEVRLMYDDIGSVMKLPSKFAKKLNSCGIKAIKFNKFTPVVTNLHNNRDHRKLVVIDGEIGYTGGINVADEYINAADRDYYWKDTAVRIYGNAVGEMAELFLQLYEINLKKERLNFDAYASSEIIDTGESGVVVPFGSGPSFFYNKPIAEEAILGLISAAEREIIITTPYLIVDYTLNRALLSAVTRGVDVKIIIPDIPDKKLVYLFTKNNASYLYDNGVKIYRATGSFLHAKSIVVDGEAAIVGTINLDFRSFIHHFENGVFMVQTKAVDELIKDVATLTKKENEMGEGVRNGFWAKLVVTVLKIFTPLF